MKAERWFDRRELQRHVRHSRYPCDRGDDDGEPGPDSLTAICVGRPDDADRNHDSVADANDSDEHGRYYQYSLANPIGRRRRECGIQWTRDEI